MIKSEKQLVDSLMSKSISRDQFLKDITTDIRNNSHYIRELLETAYNEKESEDAEYLLFLEFEFNIFTEEYVYVLCRLIEARWHYKHEDIARLLQMLKSPGSVESLYNTAISKHQYLEYDDSESLAVKCIWALGEIRTTESLEKLELLSQSEKEVIRENAIRKLRRYS